MNDIFRQIAKENGTTEKAVKEEMQFAIREAMKSAEPEAIAFWKAVAPDGKEPPMFAKSDTLVPERLHFCLKS